MSKVYIITGTSSGFGRALAEAVLSRGDRAILTARKIESISDLVAKYPDTPIAVRMDVTNESDRQAVVQTAIESFGRMEIPVYSSNQIRRS